jgi:hypothetical protein
VAVAFADVELKCSSARIAAGGNFDGAVIARVELVGSTNLGFSFYFMLYFDEVNDLVLGPCIDRIAARILALLAKLVYVSTILSHLS